MSALVPILVILLCFVIACWIISIIPFPPAQPAGTPPSPFAPYVKVILYIIAGVVAIYYLLRYLP